MKRYLLSILLVLLGSIAVQAQTTYLTNQGNMSFVFYVTNMPVDLQQLLEKTIRTHNSLVTTNVTDPLYCPAYRLQTNSVTGTDTNGQPVFSQTVTTNAAWTRQQMLSLIVSPDSTRVRANMQEIIAQWTRYRRELMGAARLQE